MRMRIGKGGWTYYSVQQEDERISWKGGFVFNAWAYSVDNFVFAGLMV